MHPVPIFAEDEGVSSSSISSGLLGSGAEGAGVEGAGVEGAGVEIGFDTGTAFHTNFLADFVQMYFLPLTVAL
jgi:hypothetical protein